MKHQGSPRSTTFSVLGHTYNQKFGKQLLSWLGTRSPCQKIIRRVSHWAYTNVDRAVAVCHLVTRPVLRFAMHEISKELHLDTVSSSLSRHQLPKHNGSIDFARLRELVTMRQVLELLGWQHAARHGAQLRGPCPIHRSQNPQSRSLSVNIEKQAYRCFGARCGSKGNQLDLYAAATGQRLYDAALDLCQRLGLEPPKHEG
jgi:hypothetical protein